MYNIIHHWLLSTDNNFNSRSISVRSKNKTVNKDNVIRMTLYRGQPIEYRSIINVLRHSATYSIANVKTLGKRKNKTKEMEGLSARVTQINHAQFSLLIFVSRRVTVLLESSVQKEEKARWQWRVRSSRLVVWSVQGRPSGSIKASVGYAVARPKKGRECLRNFFL